jgi:hypothetical protein
MGIDSIGDVMDKVKNEEFRALLLACKRQHEDLNEQIQKKLDIIKKLRRFVHR